MEIDISSLWGNSGVDPACRITEQNQARLCQELFALSMPSSYALSMQSLEESLINALKCQEGPIFTGFIIAFIQAEVVGFALLKRCFETVDLEFIATKESVRGQGIAQKLMDTFLELSKQSRVERILLEVSEVNKPAISLYERNAFKKIGVRERYYRNGENALIMERMI
jgi:ribosomal-protein-alanine N-acetyltransferase